MWGGAPGAVPLAGGQNVRGYAPGTVSQASGQPVEVGDLAATGGRSSVRGEAPATVSVAGGHVVEVGDLAAAGGRPALTPRCASREGPPLPSGSSVDASHRVPGANEAPPLTPQGRADADVLLNSDSISQYASAAMALPFPSQRDDKLDADLLDVVTRLRGQTSEQLAQKRTRVLFDIARTRANLPAPPARGGLPLPNAYLLRSLLVQEGYDDPGAADLCEAAPLLGLMGGPVAWPLQAPPDVDPLTRPEILAASASERAAFLRTVKPGKFDQELWDASVSDVTKHRMCGPFWSEDEVAQHLGTRQFVVSRRFGVQQSDKLRPCDDFTRSFVNNGIFANRKLSLSGLDSFFSLAYALFGVPSEPVDSAEHSRSGLKFWRRDHEGAYRQIPISREDQPLTVVVFCDPVSGRHVYFYHTALPFGATASVYGYNRVSRAVVFLARKLLDIPVDSYFDDFWGVDYEENVDASYRAFAALNELLGFAIKHSKDVPPTSADSLLGVYVNIVSVPFTASVTNERRVSLREVLREHIRSNKLSPASAATLAGRLNFAASALFGRVGRAPLRAVYARQHQERDPENLYYRLTVLLRAALQALFDLLECPPPRIAHAPWATLPPVTIFTDGAGDGCIGGVALLPERGGHAVVFMSRVSGRAMRRMVHRFNQIALIELLAVLTGVEEFRELIRGRDVRIFVDNTVAESSLRNGYMRRDSRDACALIGELWLQLLHLGVNVWFDRVPTAFNIADGPSRPLSPELLEPLFELGFPVSWIVDANVPEWAHAALRASLARRH